MALSKKRFTCKAKEIISGTIDDKKILCRKKNLFKKKSLSFFARLSKSSREEISLKLSAHYLYEKRFFITDNGDIFAYINCNNKEEEKNKKIHF